MSSILAVRAGTGPGVAAYAASKAGLEHLVRELARQWAPHAIRVNAIAPGYFPTAMNAPMTTDPGRREVIIARTPLGRPGEAADLAGVVVFLASPAARFLTGQTLRLDGGMTVW
jgi:NAD(P)-dependent dehydrogenase (short-subunit alcohol dehydrogenase family)